MKLLWFRVEDLNGFLVVFLYIFIIFCYLWGKVCDDIFFIFNWFLGFLKVIMWWEFFEIFLKYFLGRNIFWCKYMIVMFWWWECLVNKFKIFLLFFFLIIRLFNISKLFFGDYVFNCLRFGIFLWKIIFDFFKKENLVFYFL